MIRYAYNKSLLKIFLTILLVICVMISSNYVVMRNSLSEMQNQISENNRLVVKNINHSYEQFFNIVDNLSYSINSLPYSVFEVNSSGELDSYNVNKVQENIGRYIAPYDFIKNVMVHYKGSNTVITPVTAMRLSEFTEQNNISDKYNSKFWGDVILSSHQMIVIPSWERDKDSVNGNGIITVIGNNKMSRFNIIIFVDEEKLSDYVSRDSMFKVQSLMVFDQNKEPIITVGEKFSLEGFEKLILNSSNEFSFKNGKYEYFCFKSPYNNYFYINRVYISFANQSSVVRTNQIVVVITVIIGLIAAFLLSLYLYNRIRKTFLLIGKGKEDKSSNIFLEINKGIQEIKNENDSYRDEIRKVESEVQRSVFFKMIDDITYYRDIKNQIETYFKVVFYNEEFLMAALSFEKADMRTADGNENNTENTNIEEKSDVIKEAFTKRLSSTVLFQVESRQFIAIIGLNGGMKKSNVMTGIEDILKELDGVFHEKYSIIASLSKIYKDVKDCKMAYRDIRMCMACRNINSNKRIIDVESINFSHTIYFPGELIEKLTNCILIGNSDESISIINKIMDKNLENNTNYNRFTTVVMSIFNSITGAIALLGSKQDDFVGIEYKFYDMVLDKDINIKELRKFFANVIGQACAKAQSRNQNKLNKEFIIQYINLHYYEDLYLEKMAEIVGTSPNYFSNYFKKNFGVNFIEYLNKVRISHAREYLKNSKMSINEVAEKSGYANTSTFTNALKKYYGVSPTEYRKSIINEEGRKA